MATKQSGSHAMSRAWRYYSSIAVTSNALGAGGVALDMSDMAYASVSASSTETAVALTMYGSLATSTGPFRPLYSSTGGAITATVAGLRNTALPSAVVSTRWLRMQADAAVTSIAVYMKG